METAEEKINSRKRGRDQQNNDVTKRARIMPEVAGKIKCIELENFMCHETLKIEFEVSECNCTYIVGPNGSGKSAVFAALNIGLGGTGRSNERGKSIQSYIKEGCQYALIRIHIANEGANALTEYNEIIIVERRITEKAALFTIKTSSSAGGREEVIKKRNTRHELDLILRQFSIDLENPLSWLSQDRSRQFLLSYKPEKFYELYIKSSEMDSTESLYKNIESIFDEFTQIINTLDVEKQAKQEKYQEMKARFDAVNKLMEKKAEIQTLYWLQIWTPIRDLKNEIADLKERIEQNEVKRTEFQAMRDNLLNKIQQINGDQVRYEQDLQMAATRHREHNDRLNEMKQEIRNLKFELHDLDAAIKRKERILLGIETELQQANQNLVQLLGTSNRDVDAEKNDLLAQISAIEEQVTKIGQEKQDLKKTQQGLENERAVQKRHRDEHLAAFSQLDNRKRKTIEEKELFQRSQKNRLALFGADVPQIMQLISTNRHLFQREPIGPIGNCIKLNDQSWADPVEFLLRPLLGTFLCDSAEDRKRFDELCDSNKIARPKVITTRFSENKYNTSGKEPDRRKFTTVKSVLDIDNPTVYNYLLDKIRIESTILFDEENKARHTMHPNPPANAFKAMTLACSECNPERGSRPYQYFNREGQFRSNIFANRLVDFDPSEFERQLKEIDENIRLRNTELSKFDLEVKDIDKQISGIHQQLNSLNMKLTQFNERKFNLQNDLQNLEEILLSGDRISNLRNSIKTSEEERNQKSQELAGLRVKYAEKEEKKNERESKLEASQQKTGHLKNNYNQIQNDITSCGAQLAKIQDRMTNIDSNTQKAERNVENYRNKVEQKEDSLKKKQEEAEKEREKLIESGVLGGEHLDPPDLEELPDTDELKQKINLLQREIKNAEDCHEPTPTVEELQKYGQDYKKFKNMVKIWSDRNERLVTMIQLRKKCFNLLKASMPQKLEQYFKEYMSIRNFKEASLDIRDDERSIIIKVPKKMDRMTESAEQLHRNSGNDDDQNRSEQRSSRKGIIQDLRALSGGERSYTTACFIMALWNCMESPFRCMDEFDVFMDMVNRRAVMELLGDLAKENKEVQFFFFTPQPIHELKRTEFQVFTLKRIEGILPDNQQ